LKFSFFPKIQFFQNQHSTDDFGVFLQYELYVLASKLTQKCPQPGRKMPLGYLFTTKIVSRHLVNKRGLILIFWNFNFSQKPSFCQNQHSTDDFSVFWQYELYVLASKLTQKWLQLGRKMPLGYLFTTKIVSRHLLNKRCLILIFCYFHFSQKPNFCQNQHITDDFSVFLQYEL